ncbi:MAG: ABC transporter substrate-binding protein [Xanthobacteraceae bacterium]|jgi:ABC-type nitrate/sulfonate/bicarbonate transport system substrate-binding protein
MTRIRIAVFIAPIAASVVVGAGAAAAADKLKLAVGQCGNWDSSMVELGIRTGAYARRGVEVEALCTQGTGETQQAVISGSADIGIGIGTLGALGAFAKGAPIRIVSGSATGNADFWIVKADSPLKGVNDATSAHTVAYSTNGSSTHSVVLGFIRELGLKAKPIATGGPAATLTLAMSGQVDIGWTSPPLGFDLLDEGKIRIFARANDVPSLRGQTVRVNIANAESLKARRDAHVRFMQAFREVIDWMYSDPKALAMYADYRKTSLRNATRMRDEFFAKSALDPDTVKGMDALMVEGVNFKYLAKPLTAEELREFVQVPLR